MTFLKSAAAATALTLGLASAASATSVTYQTYYDGLVDKSRSTVIETGALTIDGQAPVPTSGNLNGQYRSPFGDENTTYFNIRRAPDENPGVLTLDGTANAFQFLWGSPDPTNMLSLFLGGEEVFALDGTNGVPPGTDGLGAILTSIDDVMFDMVRFTTNENSFEFANVSTDMAPVPLPAAGLFLIAAMGGLGGFGAMRRRTDA